MGTITASNSVFTINVPAVFITPFQLQGYAADAAFDFAESDNAEIVIGVDGLVSAGSVPFLQDGTIHLQADSVSIPLFEQWLQAEIAAQEKFPASGILTLPSIQRKYLFAVGYLKTMVAASPAGRVLKARDFKITWSPPTPMPYQGGL